MSDTEEIVSSLREFGNVKCDTACELHMGNAADKIEEQQKTINTMTEALNFIYMCVTYILARGVSDTPHQSPEGDGPQIRPISTEELVRVLRSVSNKARTTLDASGADIVEVARKLIEERKS